MPPVMAIPVMILSSLDGWYSFWQLATLLALIATFVTGLGTYVTGRWINERQGIENKKQATELLELGTDLSRQREKTVLAEKSLLELQEKLRPRQLLEREKFVSFLKEYKSGPLEIQYSGNDVESRAFANEIEAAFKDAGWSEVHVNNNVLIFPQPVGLRLRVKSADSIPEYTGAVQQAFKTINIPTQVETHDATAPNTLLLIVGSKP